MSRLPPPPPGGGRPLPPMPSGNSDDAPPPLPSRPAPARQAYKPPSRQNGSVSPSSSEEEETYDDLEDTKPTGPPPVTPSNSYPEETYDACDFGENAAADMDDGETYQEPDIVAPDSYPPPDDSLYEIDPEPSKPMSPPAPPMSSVPRRGIPPPPSIGQPALPSRPPPPPAQDSDDETPDTPSRPKLNKGFSGDGKVMASISVADLNLNRLKKVMPNKTAEESTNQAGESSDDDEKSVQDRIRKLKLKAQGAKPVLPVKPNFVGPITSKSLGPPPPPPSDSSNKKPPPVAVTTPIQSPSRNNAPSPVAPPPVQADTSFDEEIYDDAISFQDPLAGQDWFHGIIERKAAEDKLRSINEDGTFLVRKSTQNDPKQPYTLVVLFMGHNFNLKMRVRPDGKVALGEEKPDELAFKDVIQLIDHHKKNPVILVNRKLGQKETVLKRNPRNDR